MQSPTTPRGVPVVVTGVPRSGTTWLARQLAHAPGTALTGREPMNPRGSQYGLGGTLSRWTVLENPTPAQRRALRTAYLGLNPLTFSKYGHRQWAAPLPWYRVIVKDPFALMSLRTIHAQTSAHPVVIVRHPAAVLASYRRMGWSPDLEEISPLSEGRLGWEPLTPSGNDALDMGRFWTALHELALPGIREIGATVVMHEDLARAGLAGLERVYAACGLRMTSQVAAAWAPERGSGASDPQRLHNFDRDPAEVAQGWRTAISPAELEALDSVSSGTRQSLTALALDLG